MVRRQRPGAFDNGPVATPRLRASDAARILRASAREVDLAGSRHEALRGTTLPDSHGLPRPSRARCARETPLGTVVIGSRGSFTPNSLAMIRYSKLTLA